jgi:hypothetical protein
MDVHRNRAAANCPPTNDKGCNLFYRAAHDKHDERKVPFSFSFYVASPRVLLVYIVGRAKRRLVGNIVLTICQSMIVS